MTKILFLCPPNEDYLADSLLHGLRLLYGARVVDYPKCEILYRDCLDSSMARVRGGGFTLYRTLENIPIDRWNALGRIGQSEFDLVIFGNIYRSYSLFVELQPYLDPKKTLLLDGEDTPAIAPYAGRWWRRPACWLWPSAHGRYAYYKREWTEDTLHYRCFRLMPRFVARGFQEHMDLRRISFSIPADKIVQTLPRKTKDFPTHIVDREVAAFVGTATSLPPFAREVDYYADIQASRFGITTRRAGWDCLRHYEIAANGAVPCFRNLHLKPENCAPHGLNEGNCINYSSAVELFNITSRISREAYSALQRGALAWAKQNTTLAAAARLIS